LSADRYTIFPTGELHIRRIEQKDGNKSYKCQTRNRLNGQLVQSATSGRLFVQGRFYLPDVHSVPFQSC